MLKTIQNIHPTIFLLIATILGVTGDALIRKSIYNHTGTGRLGLMIVGAFLVVSYGFTLNLAPV